MTTTSNFNEFVRFNKLSWHKTPYTLHLMLAVWPRYLIGLGLASSSTKFSRGQLPCHLLHVGGWEAFRKPPNPSNCSLFQLIGIANIWPRLPSIPRGKRKNVILWRGRGEVMWKVWVSLSQGHGSKVGGVWFSRTLG